MWQPIDTIPNGDCSKEIDIWDGHARITDCFWKDGNWWYSEYELGYGWVQNIVDTPKFWMYVPEPPESSTH